MEAVEVPAPIPCPNPPCSVPIPHSFPNPANEELVIDFTGANNTDQLTSIEVTTSKNTDVQYFAEERTASTQTYSEASFLPSGTMKEVFLYNDKMMLVFHTTTTNDLLSLSTARLPEGIYILHTVIGEETFRQKIMVSHK